MSFRTNLQWLRAQRNMTQEQLAMLLGVSRQAISKWEGEKAYPEMDKLLMICNLFGCTLDDLVLGDVSRPAVGGNAEMPRPTDADVAAGGVAAGASVSGAAGSPLTAATDSTVISAANVSAAMPLPQDLTGYDAHRKSFSLSIAAGIFAIIAGTAMAVLFDEEHSILGVTPLNDFLALTFIFVGVIIGLACLIPAGMSHATFVRRHPYVEDFYTDEDRARASRTLAVGVVVGIMLILCGVACEAYCDAVLGNSDGWPATVMLLLVAFGVFCFVYFGMLFGLMDIDDYNKDAERDRRQREGTTDFYGRLTGMVCGIIMLVSTIIALWLLFAPVHKYDQWWSGWQSDQGLFWLPWPIGGICCGIAVMIIQIVKEYRERK